MTRDEFKIIENYMLSQMKDNLYEINHVYRVLYFALDISMNLCTSDDINILIASCLLHDIGRKKQYENHNLCHAQVGGDMAYEFLLSLKWTERNAFHVKECICSHRYSKDNPPKSIEAKILFDADKLDVCGAIGIARTLLDGGHFSKPLCTFDDETNIIVDREGSEISSFFQEYNYKLKNVYDLFFTEYAKQVAARRRNIAVKFYDNLQEEVLNLYKDGIYYVDTLLVDRRSSVNDEH